jgi:hypothetical protein
MFSRTDAKKDFNHFQLFRPLQHSNGFLNQSPIESSSSRKINPENARLMLYFFCWTSKWNDHHWFLCKTSYRRSIFRPITANIDTKGRILQINFPQTKTEIETSNHCSPWHGYFSQAAPVLRTDVFENNIGEHGNHDDFNKKCLKTSDQIVHEVCVFLKQRNFEQSHKAAKLTHIIHEL